MSHCVLILNGEYEFLVRERNYNCINLIVHRQFRVVLYISVARKNSEYSLPQELRACDSSVYLFESFDPYERMLLKYDSLF